MTTMPSIEQMLEELNAKDEGLTSWELDFLESITNRWESGRELTPKQTTCLHKIWEEKT